MDEGTTILAEAAVNLATLAVKGTVTAVSKRIRAIKNEKDLEIVRNKYDELINELLSEREEAVRIAQMYKSEVDRLEISDKDIEHLNQTISQVINVLNEMTPGIDYTAIAQLQSLVNANTLKAMQLLGFNFKAAIGEPLTTLCAQAILSKSSFKSNAPKQPKNTQPSGNRR